MQNNADLVTSTHLVNIEIMSRNCLQQVKVGNRGVARETLTNVRENSVLAMFERHKISNARASSPRRTWKEQFVNPLIWGKRSRATFENQTHNELQQKRGMQDSARTQAGGKLLGCIMYIGPLLENSPLWKIM